MYVFLLFDLEVGSCIFLYKSFFLTFHVDFYSPICVMQKPSKQLPSSSSTPYLSVSKNKVAKEPQKGIIKYLKKWERFIQKYDITICGVSALIPFFLIRPDMQWKIYSSKVSNFVISMCLIGLHYFVTFNITGDDIFNWIIIFLQLSLLYLSE